MLPFVIFVCGSFILSVIDFQTHRLPNKPVLALIIATSLAILIQNDNEILIRSLKFGLFYLLILFGLATASKNSIGFGDVKYSFACGQIVGAYLPNRWLEILWVMFALAAMFSLTLIALGKLSRNDRIAFGPFMAISTIAFVANSLG